MAYQPSYYQTTPLPIPVPTKSQQVSYYTPQNTTYGVSPPEAPESVTTGSGMTPAYGNSTYSATSSSYAGSASGEYDSTSANGVDLQEYMQDRFSGTFDPLPLDRTLAVQAQTSGLLNAKHREIMDLQALAQQRLARTRARLQEGYQDAKEVKANLEWTQHRMG
ncbi:hypothetical protein NHQ30_002845 [Ciborinia camelliae]|nr:hypothetical protein NHQ30_002845 [Ciborinia camelliae]